MYFGRTSQRIKTASIIAAVWLLAVSPLAGAQEAAGGRGDLGQSRLAPGSAPEETLTEFDCLLEPMKTVILSAPVIGVVEDVLVERGDFVTEGQLLASLEAAIEKTSVEVAKARRDMTAELRGSEARYDFEKRRLAQNEKLHKEGVVSDLQFDEIQSNLLLAEANVLQARENRELAALQLKQSEAALDRRSIHSTLNGVVVDVILNPGEYADPPQILEIAQIDPLRVEVFAPVAVLGRIDVGMEGEVIPELPVGGSYTGKVTVVDRVVDAASGTFGVRLELPNPEHELSAGLKCRVRF